MHRKSWPTEKLMGWGHFEEIIGRIYPTEPTRPSIYYRGQSSAKWSLKPSICRQFPETFDAGKADWVEIQAVEQFQRRAHLAINPTILPKPYDIPGWLALMQHYGAPTRLLDWTHSAYVALYFAVQDGFETDGAVWLFNSEELYLGMRHIYGDEYKWLTTWYDPKDKNGLRSELRNPIVHRNALIDSPDKNMVFDFFSVQRQDMLNFASERLIAQQGTFTVSKALFGDHAQAIHDATSAIANQFGRGESPTYRKVIIPSKLKRNFLRKLNDMNINSSSLFPGLDGLGRSISGMIHSHIDWLTSY